MPVSHPVFDDLDHSSGEEESGNTSVSLGMPLRPLNGDFGTVFNDAEEDRKELRLYGYLLLGSAWVMTVGALGCLLNLWGWVFSGVDFVGRLKRLQNPLLTFLIESVIAQEDVVDNYYVCFAFLNFVVLWIWAVASWISMKLFRHSKGGGS